MRRRVKIGICIKSWIRICIKAKSWIRICNPGLQQRLSTDAIRVVRALIEASFKKFDSVPPVQARFSLTRCIQNVAAIFFSLSSQTSNIKCVGSVRMNWFKLGTKYYKCNLNICQPSLNFKFCQRVPGTVVGAYDPSLNISGYTNIFIYFVTKFFSNGHAMPCTWCRLNACFLTVENGLQDDLVWEVEREDIRLRSSLQFDPHCHTHRKTCTIKHGEHLSKISLSHIFSQIGMYLKS